MSFEILISWAIEKWSEVLLYVIWNPRKQQNHSVDSFTGHPVDIQYLDTLDGMRTFSLMMHFILILQNFLLSP